MALVDLTTQYIVIIYAALLFTVLAILETELNGKNVILQYFAGVLWLISGFAQFISGETTSILTYGVTYLFLGFAFIFIAAAMYNSFFIIKTKRGARV